MAICTSCGIDNETEGPYCRDCVDFFNAKSNHVLKFRKPLFFFFLFLFLSVCSYFIYFSATQKDTVDFSPENVARKYEESHAATTEKTGIDKKDRLEDLLVYDITKIAEIPPLDSKEKYTKWMLEHTFEKEKHISARWDLSEVFIASHELEGEATIRAFLLAPREHFVRKKNMDRAYEDTWLPIAYGATITDPDVVCMMTTSLDLKPHHKVLEIGTGSGYQSAILSNLSNYVYTMEIIEPLFRETNALYEELEADYLTYKNIRRKLADGFYGWEEYAPFERIIITCAIDHIPPPLLRQLSPGGIIVVPFGPPGRQNIMQITKKVDESGAVVLDRRDVYNGLSVKFIPFRNTEGESYSEEVEAGA